MRVLVVRHAIAEEPDPARWPNDADRPLTAKGEQRFKDIASHLATAAPEPAAILAGPFVRARQTAELLSEVTEWGPVIIEAGLASGAQPDRIAAVLRARNDAVACVVGHEPDLGRFVTWWIGASGGAISLRKGGVALLDADEIVSGAAELAWLATPRLLRG